MSEGKVMALLVKLRTLIILIFLITPRDFASLLDHMINKNMLMVRKMLVVICGWVQIFFFFKLVMSLFVRAQLLVVSDSLQLYGL